MTSLNESQQIQKIIDTTKEIIMFANWMPVGLNNMSADGLVIISDISLYILRYDTQCQLIMRAKEYLISIERIELNESDELKFSFSNKKPIILKFPYPQDIMSIFMTQLWQILLTDELPLIAPELQVSFKQFSPEINIAKRFYSKALTKNAPVSLELFQLINKYFERKPKTVVISELPGVENMLDVLLFAIYPFDFITSLVIDGETTNSFYSNIAQNVQYLANIKHLTFLTLPDEYFATCLTSLLKKNFERIEFKSLALTKEHLDIISSFFVKSSVRFIGFEKISFNCRESEVNAFFTALSSASSARRIGMTTIRMDKRPELLNTFSLLKHLYLRGSGLNLSKLFKTLMSSTHIVTADLSGSRCRKLLVGSELALPAKLNKLILDDISWTDRSLMELLNIVEKHTMPISLSVCRASMTKDHWNSFFNEKLPVKNLISLSWSDNPICQNFVKSICKSQIKFLSVGGHLEGGSAVDFFTASSNIEFLDISGDGQKKICEQAVDTIIAASKTKKVKYIDFSGNNIGDNNFNTVIPYLNKFDGIIMDENQIISSKSYQYLQQEFSKRQMKIPAPVPMSDFYFAQRKHSDLGKVVEFRSKFHFQFEVRNLPENLTLAGSDFADRVKKVKRTTPEDAKGCMMIPAPLSDYLPLLRERELQLEDDPVETDKWALDVIDIPNCEFEEIKSNIMEATALSALRSALLAPQQ